jgi:hypothetical protein
LSSTDQHISKIDTRGKYVNYYYWEPWPNDFTKFGSCHALCANSYNELYSRMRQSFDACQWRDDLPLYETKSFSSPNRKKVCGCKIFSDRLGTRSVKTATTRGKIMACENDKCEKYGMHHDYKNGVEVRKCQFCESDDQPERSKREDLTTCSPLPKGLEKDWSNNGRKSYWVKMRCSELYGNIERDK